MHLYTKLENKLDEIADFLLNHEDDNTEIGALNGISGNALFHFYYSKYKDDDLHAEKGAAIIEETFGRIQNGYNYPTFCDGIAGACWVLELLKEEKFIELEEDIITQEVDDYLFEKMNLFINDNNFDFLHGAIGIGLYYLKRFENNKNVDLKKTYEEYLHVLIDAIYDTAIFEGDTVKWKSKINAGESQNARYNLGLAHGIPSIVMILSKMIKHKSFINQVTKLLKPACNYIINCKHKDMSLTSSFPNRVIEGEYETFNSRLAWCYGDLGVGISLLNAGRALKDQSVINESFQILEKTTLRKDKNEAGIEDAGLCHGAYGVMLMYHNLFNKTGKKVFRNTSENWAQIGIDMSIYIDGYAGYKTIYNSFSTPDSSFLEGISGIGLSIISYIIGVNENLIWPESLLID